MKKPSNSDLQEPIRILFADDDIDDRFFFDEELSSLPIPTYLTTVENGKLLMEYLDENSSKLPDLLFLDLRLPGKSGLECLKEIKSDVRLKKLPVIIYSNMFNKEMTDELYNYGAHYYVRKTTSVELQKVLHYVLSLLLENRFAQPFRDGFVLNLAKAKSNDPMK